MYTLKHLHGVFAPGLFIDPAHFERKCYVIDAIEVWEQRVALKHHCRATPRWHPTGDIHRAEGYAATVRIFVTGNHAQGRRLAASRWPKHAAVLTCIDGQIDVVHRNDIAKALGQRLQV